MLLLKKLNKLLLILLCLVSVSVNATETKWDVAIVFRGDAQSGPDDEQMQKDIDENILELARLPSRGNLRIGIYRELNGKSFTYLPYANGQKEISLGDILYRQDLNQIIIPGIIKKNSAPQLNSFLKSFYKDADSKKALVIYSHGKGAEGLRGISNQDLKESLSLLPHLDLLWFDACFMGNMEFLYELRSVSDYTISSEEAEFTSGLPFQSLGLLTSTSSGREAAVLLANNFIESYSYLKNGQQRNYVSVSSATISVVENKKLDVLAKSLGVVSKLTKELTSEQKNKLNKTLLNKASMDDKSLIDLGTLLIELRKIVTNQNLNAQLTKLIRLMNIESIKSLKTNPRIHIQNPEVESKLVYGFNNWKDGASVDVEENEVFDSIIAHEGYLLGPNRKDWPFKTIRSKKIIIAPFAPGINVFNYYFLNSKNGKLLTEALSFARTHDVVESFADSASTPLIYSAYTQQVGTKAERYTGLNITMPGSVPSLDYFELEFNQLAQWLSL